MTNHCGTCTMCCKILGIVELAKPANTWCEFCNIGKGCQVYGEHPQSCKDYECMYVSLRKDGHDVPLSLRPDKSKVMITVPEGEKEVIAVHVDPNAKDAWRKTEVRDTLAQLALGGYKVVIGVAMAQDKVLMEGKGTVVTTRTIKMSEPDENGVQWYQP